MSEALATVAHAAKRLKVYDSRLDSDDVIERQQAEIEALRTCLIAVNSESCGEYARLREKLDAAIASHEGQLRNTLAFQKEAERFRAALQEIASGLSVNDPYDIANAALKD